MRSNSLSTKADDIIRYFASLSLDESWSFDDLSANDTNYITHGYHRYPAKFIPQLTSRLIRELSEPGDLICDPFMGSGTTLVESRILARRSVGVDINPIAVLIASAKTTPIEPAVLEESFHLVRARIEAARREFKGPSPSGFGLSGSGAGNAENQRIDYWFRPETKESLALILREISRLPNEPLRHFFLCAFSHILKNCSIWLMKSIKPTRDFGKSLPDAHNVFLRHCQVMMRKNAEYFDLLQKARALQIECRPLQGDSRTIPVEDNSVALVVTSPPYVTSYEYADLHQLSALWLGYAEDVASFRKGFIGSSHRGKNGATIDSKIGEETVSQLAINGTGKADEVATYFSEMRESFVEMHRYLKKGGKACLVIGNTSFKKVQVPNAEVFFEQMENIGFTINRVIKRRIPSKILPQTRDPLTGKFTSSSNNNKTLAYPHEYIVVMEKQ